MDTMPTANTLPTNDSEKMNYYARKNRWPNLVLQRYHPDKTWNGDLKNNTPKFLEASPELLSFFQANLYESILFITHMPIDSWVGELITSAMRYLGIIRYDEMLTLNQQANILLANADAYKHLAALPLIKDNFFTQITVETCYWISTYYESSLTDEIKKDLFNFVFIMSMLPVMAGTATIDDALDILKTRYTDYFSF